MFSSLAESAKLSTAIDREKVSTEQMQRAAMKVLAQFFLQQVAHAPDKIKEWDSPPNCCCIVRTSRCAGN